MPFIFPVQLLLAGLFAGSAAGVEVSGTIVDANTRKPVQKVYVYTVKGEEEAVSDTKGNFHFVSWQQAPLRIHVQHVNYREKLVLVHNGLKSLQIEIVQK